MGSESEFFRNLALLLQVYRLRAALVATTVVGLLIAASLLIPRGNASTTTSQPVEQGSSATTPSLNDAFCALALERVPGTKVDENSWRTVPTELEDVFRSWAAAANKAQYVPTQVRDAWGSRCPYDRDLSLAHAELDPLVMARKVVTDTVIDVVFENLKGARYRLTLPQRPW
jgi:hypothetical protein